MGMDDGVVGDHDRPRAEPNPIEGAVGHGQRQAFAEADDLDGDGLAAPRRNLAARADAYCAVKPGQRDEQPLNAGYAPVDADGRKPFDFSEEAFHSGDPGPTNVPATAESGGLPAGTGCPDRLNAG